MRFIVFFIVGLISLSSFAEQANQKSTQLAQEFLSPTYSQCSCNYSIAENGGARMMPVLFSPCDQSFALMMLREQHYKDARITVFLPRNVPIGTKPIEFWKSGSYETTLDVKRTGNGEESEWFKGTLTIKKNNEQQVMDVIGGCGL